jgi:hypothetical protein
MVFDFKGSTYTGFDFDVDAIEDWEVIYLQLLF